MTTIRILLVDDEQLVREGLRHLLEVEDGIEVVGEAGDGVEALARVPVCRPDVALVDVRMPGMDGVDLVERLNRLHPDVAAVMLTTFDDDAYVLGALTNGARGYLLKDIAPAELVAAIRRVYLGGTVLGDPAAACVVTELRRCATGTPPQPRRRSHEETLTAREAEVARLVGSGLSNREIAVRLGLAYGTVKNHVSRTLRKLDVRDRTQLALQLRRPTPPTDVGSGPVTVTGHPPDTH